MFWRFAELVTDLHMSWCENQNGNGHNESFDVLVVVTTPHGVSRGLIVVIVKSQKNGID